MNKRKVIVLVLAIVIYVISILIYNRFKASNDYISVLISNTDIKRGEKLNEENLEQIKIEKSSVNNMNFLTKENLKENIYSACDLKKGTIIENIYISSKKGLFESDEKSEYISLKIESTEDFLSYQISKEDLVNIYFTYKNEEVKNLDMGKEAYSTENGYTTVKLLEGILIQDIYDKYGQSIKQGEVNGNVPDNILIKVDKNMAIKLKNIKDLGKFSLTM